MIITVATKLKMWEATHMPESEKVTVDGKTSYQKTGKKVEKTTYTFIDELGDKLVFLSDNEYRTMEGKAVELDLDITHDDFNRKNKIQLKSVREA